MRSRNTASDAAARFGNARSSSPRTMRAHSEFAVTAGATPPPVAAAEVGDARAALAVRPEVLVLAIAILADDSRRRVQDDLRRPVIAFELDDRRVRKVGFEIEDVAEVCAAPFVDGLIRIAHDAE